MQRLDNLLRKASAQQRRHIPYVMRQFRVQNMPHQSDRHKQNMDQRKANCDLVSTEKQLEGFLTRGSIGVKRRRCFPPVAQLKGPRDRRNSLERSKCRSGDGFGGGVRDNGHQRHVSLGLGFGKTWFCEIGAAGHTKGAISETKSLSFH